MEKDKIKKEVLNILTSNEFKSLQIKIENISDDTSLLNDVGLDSIQILELIVSIEKKFEFSFNTMELRIDIFDRFSDLIDFIDQNIKQTIS